MLRHLSRRRISDKRLDPNIHRSLTCNGNPALQGIARRHPKNATITSHAQRRQRPHVSSVSRQNTLWRSSTNGLARSSFDTLRSRYFSNAAVAITTSMDDHDDNNDNNENTAPHSIAATNLKAVSRRMMPPSIRSWYAKHCQIPTEVLRDAFDIQDLRNANLSNQDIQHRDPTRVTCLWTATFTCPVTSKVYDAAPSENDDDIPNNDDNHEKEDELPVLIDGRYYYTTKKAAVMAASIRCMDDKASFETPPTASAPPTGADGNGSNPFFPNAADNPRSQLQTRYRTHRVFPSADCFLHIKHNFVGGSSGKGGTWWTAAFQCPVSQTWYGTVDLPQVSSSRLKMEHAGRWWYRQKPFAMHAASKRVLETVDWESLGKDVQERMEVRNGHYELAAKYYKEQKDVELKANIQPLLYWYRQEHGMDISGDANGASVEDYFVTTTADSPGRGTRWTASFLCPLTAERFDARTLSDVESERIEDFIWYSNENSAMQAAALCAFDILQYRKNGQNAPRFCKEDPALFSPSLHVVNASINRSDQEMSQPDNSLDQLMDCDDSESIVDNEEDEEDYLIEVIPQQTNFIQGRRASTFDVIAETWIESTRTVASAAETGGWIDNTDLAIKQRQEAIHRAEEWLAQQDTNPVQSTSSDRTLFRNSGEMSKLTIANAILSSLAEAHQHVPFNSEPVGVEDAAERILESMWSSNTYTPDCTSYASYLKCLEGGTTELVAMRAREIVDEMESGTSVKGRSLPQPNSLVYASLYQVLAQAGIMDLSWSSKRFPLTRMMILSNMSAMGHDPSLLEIDVAKQHIDRMKEMFEETSDPTFQPDTEVYNAPLRWSGGGIWSRGFSRAIPWDSYSDIYSKGVLPDNSDSVSSSHRQARNTENWLAFIQSQSEVCPNIETVESVIQAWARCGTNTGLHEAEKIAAAVLKGEYSSVEARIQTFYPIVAGWAYSGSREGPGKVIAWLGGLREIFKDVETRRRFAAAPFLSQLSLQRQLLADSKLFSVESSMQKQKLVDLTTAACSCSSLLQEIVHDYMALPSFFLPRDLFVLTSQAWCNVASATESTEDLDQCFQGVRNVQELFEEMVVWLDQNRSDETNSQLVHLLNQASSLYGSHLLLLREHNRLSRISNEGYDATKHLLAIEEIVRRSTEFCRYLEDIPDENSVSKYEFGDSAVFPTESLLRNPVCDTWNEYLSETLSVLEDIVTTSFLQGPDVARLCHVIANAVDMPVISRQQMIESLTRLANDSTGTDNAAIMDTLRLLKEAVQSQQQSGVGYTQQLDNAAGLVLSKTFKSEPKTMANLPVSVQNKIKDLQYSFYLGGDVDEGILSMLKDLSEPAALELLERFRTKLDTREVENKTAFLAGMLWKEGSATAKSSSGITDRRPSAQVRSRKPSRGSAKRASSAKGKRRPRPHLSKM